MTNDIEPLENWLPHPAKPILISGPCSAESEQQVLEIARQLAPLQPSLFRAGIWKPRTRPGAFEGIGEVGLPWLQQVKKAYGLSTTVEVATAHHVELCLAHGIDTLWIGARSTVNPFTVQEIADALKGVDIPVMVKNPVNPDLNLWIGAIERMQHAGITKLAAIHRGFSSYEKTKYRNKPMWEIPIELRRLMPSLPIFCDPSHITGKRALLKEVSQKAYDLSFDGLMIESHTDPDHALSDNEQQITPANLRLLLAELVVRNQGTDDPEFNTSLEQLRAIIDRQDEELVKKLRERMEIVEKIGHLKKEKNITILQPERWAEVFATRTDWADNLGLSKEFVLKIFQLVHQESIRKQTQVMNEEK
ncbi:MAG: bifunctional 3-deoxy-7-phosphoheptulonate synthase/chorismate mutase type II [Chitinophagales bacterium]|nr:bifunctional 3-deoxy-7-phosphoheptulonate synthase/chorismate mutase type II [Chitinophagales bacterium]